MTKPNNTYNARIRFARATARADGRGLEDAARAVALAKRMRAV